MLQDDEEVAEEKNADRGGSGDSSRRRREQEREQDRRLVRERERHEREAREREREREKERRERERPAPTRSRSRSREPRTVPPPSTRLLPDRDIYEEEEEHERRKLERKLRDKQIAYQELLKKWEQRERKKARDYEKEQDREEERKAEEVIFHHSESLGLSRRPKGILWLLRSYLMSRKQFFLSHDALFRPVCIIRYSNLSAQ